MAQKTFYPTFRRLVHGLVMYLGNHQAAMIARLGITSTTYATDLAALTAALNQVETNWPSYDELP